tara:strand:- start:418 stop:630 length:213 start_codon:yes stop_codon:yes gene_type:complete
MSFDTFTSSPLFELNFTNATGIGSVFPLVISILNSDKTENGNINSKIVKANLYIFPNYKALKIKIKIYFF